MSETKTPDSQAKIFGVSIEGNTNPIILVEKNEVEVNSQKIARVKQQLLDAMAMIDRPSI